MTIHLIRTFKADHVTSHNFNVYLILNKPTSIIYCFKSHIIISQLKPKLIFELIVGSKLSREGGQRSLSFSEFVFDF